MIVTTVGCLSAAALEALVDHLAAIPERKGNTAKVHAQETAALAASVDHSAQELSLTKPIDFAAKPDMHRPASSTTKAEAQRRCRMGVNAEGAAEVRTMAESQFLTSLDCGSLASTLKSIEVGDTIEQACPGLKSKIEVDLVNGLQDASLHTALHAAKRNEYVRSRPVAPAHGSNINDVCTKFTQDAAPEPVLGSTPSPKALSQSPIQGPQYQSRSSRFFGWIKHALQYWCEPVHLRQAKNYSRTVAAHHGQSKSPTSTCHRDAPNSELLSHSSCSAHNSGMYADCSDVEENTHDIVDGAQAAQLADAHPNGKTQNKIENLINNRPTDVEEQHQMVKSTEKATKTIALTEGVDMSIAIDEESQVVKLTKENQQMVKLISQKAAEAAALNEEVISLKAVLETARAKNSKLLSLWNQKEKAKDV